MCMTNGVNWILAVIGKKVETLFVDDKAAEKLSKEGRHGITGHSIIRETAKEPIRYELEKGESGDFSTPANFPDEVVSAMKAGKMYDVLSAICTADQLDPLINAKAKKEYEITDAECIMALYNNKKHRSKIWA